MKPETKHLLTKLTGRNHFTEEEKELMKREEKRRNFWKNQLLPNTYFH